MDEAWGEERIRVLVADPQPLTRHLIRTALEEDLRLQVVREAGNVNSAVLGAIDGRPDVALVSLDLPGGGGVRATQWIRRRISSCRIVVVGDARDEAVRVLESGAAGYVAKTIGGEELAAAVHAAHEAYVVLSTSVVPALLHPQPVPGGNDQHAG
jgi:two-component system response regulator DesR